MVERFSRCGRKENELVSLFSAGHLNVRCDRLRFDVEGQSETAFFIVGTVVEGEWGEGGGIAGHAADRAPFIR